MELRVLKYFLTAAETGSISGAAALLHISQPALSKQLRDLETELGTQLFQRTNRGIRLTETGQYLRDRSREILTLVSNTTDNLQNQTNISGEIAIGSGETQAFQPIATLLDQLIATYPQIRLRLYSGNADAIKEQIDHGLLDFGLVIAPVDKQKYDYLQLPAIDRWGILIHRHHPLGENSQITREALLTLPLLVSNQTLVKSLLTDWLGGNLAQLQVVGTYNLLYNASLLVKEGTVAALCIDGIINTADSELCFIPLAPDLNGDISIIWKKGQHFAPAAKTFLKMLDQQFYQAR